ncbi:RHS repeat domain-containing protein, partial [Xanthomonas fragariae]
NANQVTGLAWGKAGQAALGSLGYGYNSVGQLVAQTGTHASQSLPPASSGNSFDDNNRQTKANNVALSYDESGHLLNDGSRSYIWDDRDRLSEIQQGGTTIASFSYDALGRRTVKTEGGTSTQYLYDGQDAVQETQGTTVNPILTGLGIDQRYARNDTGGRTYFLSDQLGSTRLLTNAAGGVVQRYEYDPYGTTTQSSTAYTNPYQYTGREKDSSGLYYYRARYYRPQWGRFISEDPIGLAAGLNSYAYVEGNPLAFTDPLGLIKLPENPSGLPSGYKPDSSHRDPNGERWTNGTDVLDFHRGRAGKPGWRGKDHWHHNGGDKHYSPGDECPTLDQDNLEDKDFIDEMSEITGLTGGALIIYLIMSEGSRAFPPRNLIPIP